MTALKKSLNPDLGSSRKVMCEKSGKSLERIITAELTRTLVSDQQNVDFKEIGKNFLHSTILSSK